MPFPSVEQYLAGLPSGFDSYPHAQAKSSVALPYRQGAVGARLLDCPDLPAPIRAFVEQPPTIGAWVSEVMLAALICAAHDAYFAPRGGDDELQTYIQTTNRALFTGPLYRILFSVVSPERLLTGAAQRWSAFHRGSKLETLSQAPGRAMLSLTHPPSVFSDFSLRGHGTSFALAAELANAKDVEMGYTKVDPGLTRYVITWR